MKLALPSSLTRKTSRALLKLSASSPTILVVAGVVGLGATAVVAARATRNLDPVLEKHKEKRAEIGYIGEDTSRQREVLALYIRTSMDLTKLYGPSIFIGLASAVSVLGGHNILRTRHVATLAAYSGLAEQFNSYRQRVAATLGEDVEKGIHEGAHGVWKDDPVTGETKLMPEFSDVDPDSYLRPWFDEANVHYGPHSVTNYYFLKGVQQHMNHTLQTRGHVFLNDVLDALHMRRCKEGAVAGWIYDSPNGDGYIDFGFMTGIDPHTTAFRNGAESTVRLNFNIDAHPIWQLI